MDIYIALVHHPVRNRRGETVATAVTNLDIHDLARSARTYGVRGYYLITPIAQQRSLVSRIATHWVDGDGRRSNPIRARAFELVRVAPDLRTVTTEISSEAATAPLTVATGASIAPDDPRAVSYPALRDRLETERGACLLCFGTGWGLTDDALSACDLVLPGVHARRGRDGYNHLSVRAAVAIILDRLLGER